MRVGKIITAALFFSWTTMVWAAQSATTNKTPALEWQANGEELRLEILSDVLLHFEWSRLPHKSKSIEASPMIAQQTFKAPKSLRLSSPDNSYQFSTAAVTVLVDRRSLCLTITNNFSQTVLTHACPSKSKQVGIEFTQEDTRNLYGLGSQFVELGNPDGDWIGRVRTPGNEFGNAMVAFHGGFHPNTQIPILYALGTRANYALFIDDVYPEEWNFKGSPWTMHTKADSVKGYFLFGKNLKELRHGFMDLVGHPLVPPKKIFGFWISEWGYDNWAELDDKLNTLREHRFPMDGAIMDLQWFGGINGNSEDSHMGSLSWDLQNFPQPEKKIASLRDDWGLGTMVIEESYVAKGLSEHHILEEKGYLAKNAVNGKAAYLTMDPWWGKGGMLDWTNPNARVFWHDWKRQPLIDMGVLAHWTDLGEPELFDPAAVYYGFPEQGKHAHADIHNMYNFYWSKGIYEGYERHHLSQRPFSLSRSGAAGVQRFGTALWSADIAANLANYRTHMNVQMNMSLSGIDYYGSDTGGFYREAFDGPDYGELYTQWFADSTAFDVPLRVHTKNLCNCYETAPDRNGSIESNLSNLRQRYELTPYYYSLGHRAHLYGDPMVAPLFYYFQDDLKVREMGAEKMVGTHLLIVGIAAHGARSTKIYLPKGTWFDYLDHKVIRSAGQWFENYPLYRSGLFKLPVFALAGAIIPKMLVDDQTMNVDGRRLDGSSRNELILRIYPDERASAFTLFEDDGKTTDYLRGGLATTLITQKTSNEKIDINLHATQFEDKLPSYLPAARATILEVVSDRGVPASVQMNRAELKRFTNEDLFNAASEGWIMRDENMLVIKVAPMAPTLEKRIRLKLSRERAS